MAASNNSIKDTHESENGTKISEFMSQECSMDGRSIGGLNTCFDFNDCNDDEYIDIEVGSAMFWEAASRKLNTQREESREFEFDAKALALEDVESVDSPADELFYKGRLLPLHLPPRLQMVEKLLASEKSSQQSKMAAADQNKSTSVSNMVAEEQKLTVGGLIDRDQEDFDPTPYESCDATPYDSCEHSQELNPDLYEGSFKESYSVRTPSSVHEGGESKGKHRLTMLKKAKKLVDKDLAPKLKASRAYLKSLFTKSTVDKNNQQYYQRAPLDQKDLVHNCDPDNMVSKARGCISHCMKVITPGSANGDLDVQREGYKVAEAVARSIHKENSSMIEDVGRRKSFSGSLSSMMAAEYHSSNVFFSSNRVSPNHSSVILKRSSSANLDMESAIQGAIAHCKQSAHSAPKNIEPSDHHVSCKFQVPISNGEEYVNGSVHARPRLASKITVCDKPEKPGLCRG